MIESLNREYSIGPEIIPYTKEELSDTTKENTNLPKVVHETSQTVKPKGNGCSNNQEEITEKKLSLPISVSPLSKDVGLPVDGNKIISDKTCPVKEQEENSTGLLDFIDMKNQLKIISEYSEPRGKEKEAPDELIPQSLPGASMGLMCEEPSAPADFSYSYGISQINIELPVDREVEEVKFPLLFNECVSQVVQDQFQLGQQKAFTREQLRAFYENSLLEQEAEIVESFLDSQKNLEVHALFECLTRYMRCRLALKSTLDELQQLNKEIDGLVSSQLWTIENKKIVTYGECSDGRRVKAQDEYPMAHFNSKALGQLVRQMKQLRETIQEKLALEVFIKLFMI